MLYMYYTFKIRREKYVGKFVDVHEKKKKSKVTNKKLKVLDD
jgi:hypothetical protein